MSAGRGRPPIEYDPAYHVSVIGKLYRRGCGNEEVAEILDISVQTLNKWMQEHPDLLEAKKAGREDFDNGRVEQGLLKRALGYWYTETKTEQIELRQGRGANLVRVPADKIITMRKHMAPNVTAMIFWLCNRNPDRWKNIQTIVGKMDHSHSHEFDISKLSKIGKKKLEQLADMLEEAIGDEATSSPEPQNTATRDSSPVAGRLHSPLLGHGRN